MQREWFVFVHVTAAMGLVAALAIEGALLRQVRRAQPVAVGHRGAVDAALDGFGLVSRLGGLSLLAVLLSGGYLAAGLGRAAGGAWIGASLAGLVLVALIGATVTRRGLARLRAALRTAAPTDVRPSDAGLRAAYQARVALVLAIVCLMTTKPALAGSLLTLGLALAGAGAAALAAGPRPSPRQPAADLGGVV